MIPSCSHSQDKRSFRIISNLATILFNPVVVIVAKIVESNTIFLEINNLEKLMLDFNQ